MALSPLGKILSVSATLPLIKIFGDKSCRFGQSICFYKCEETVKLEAREKGDKVPVKVGLKAIGTNKYFWLATGLWTFQATIALFTGTILPYYCKYVMMDDTYFSFLFLVETLTTVIATILICPTLLKKFGKRKMSLYGIIFAFIGHLIFVMVAPLNPDWLMFSCFIRGLFFAPLNSVIFGFFGDVVDYTQWKYHVRPEGLVFSGGSVGNKIGGGLVSAILTGLLTMAGYISSAAADVVQPQSAVDMIVSIYCYGVLIIWAAVILVLYSRM